MRAKTTWLLIDTNFMCYRAWFSGMGRLSHGETATGVLYGVLRDVMGMCELHGTHNVVFAFDKGPGLRYTMHPEYKAGRVRDADFEDFRKQVDDLRDRWLPEAGFPNVLHAAGYEADDIIASLCKRLPPRHAAIIVSSDKDLYQLLVDQRVWMWNPARGRAYTYDAFYAEFGIRPAMWPDVKALAGCSSDNILGLPGIGEKTAAKFLRGELKPESKAFKTISAGGGVWQENLELVRLPLYGTPRHRPTPGGPPAEAWDAVVEKLGLKSLRRTPRGKENGFGI